MASEEKKTAAQLIAEIHALQEAGDVIREKMQETMKDLQANAEQMKAAVRRAKDNDASQ